MDTFREEQRVRNQALYWWVATPITLLGILGLYQSIESNTAGHLNATLALVCLVAVLLPLFYFFVGLKTDYNELEIVIRYFPLPFVRRKILWSQVTGAYVRKFDRSEFKATGVGAIPFGRGKAYHLYSQYGLQLETKDGDRILIGTRKPKSLQEFVNRKIKL